ncbi:MAG: HAD-IC family P-type ATPase [Thermoleophilia bacterium]|nr:HAD-IC family P-type ATPase [Thermoleophilia bacterium]
MLGALLVLTLALGDPKDALFGGVIVANTLIGIVQEVRAKRVLDRLALLVAPRARVWRDGALVDLPVEGVVDGDVVRIEPGDQIVADGEVVASRGLTVDESILTGESEAVGKDACAPVLSGAYCLSGSGDYRVEAVGAESFAERLAAEARGAGSPLSPLQHDINRILRITVSAMVPLAVLLIASLMIRGAGVEESAATVVAGLVPLVPEGLVLLTSLTFAVAAVRLARLGTLAQRLNAVESLASVDTLCLDKTGTLTENRIRVSGLEAVDGRGEDALRDDLGALAASAGARNATMAAIAEAAPGSVEEVSAEVPFSSARKWSGVTLPGRGTLVLGGPDVLGRAGVALGDDLRARVAGHAAAGRRVVLLAGGPATLAGDDLPGGLRPLGLVLLTEAVREEAPGTIAYLTREGVATRVISGDDPVTVGAVASAVGVPGAGAVVSGADLPADPAGLDAVVAGTVVYGRITPEQKRELVRAMTRGGRYVAMTGDGVNDVLALKEARLGIAMGNGSQMAKGVADLILLTSSFATVPRAVEEGRRIIRNTHRVAKLFVAKTVYSAVILATLGMAPIAYPFLPRQITVASTLTIGVPAFFLALSPSEGPVRREGFIRSLLAFVVPAGVVSALTTISAYLLVRGPLDAGIAEGRTAAVLATTGMGLAIVIAVERGPEGRRVRRWVTGMCASFGAALVLGIQVPWLRDWFAAVEPAPRTWAVVAACLAAGVVALAAVRRIPWLARIESGSA